MPANTNPIFVLTPSIGMLRSATTSARDGTQLSSPQLAYTASVNGSRVDRITITLVGTQSVATSGLVARVYLSATASNFRLYKEVALTTLTPSTTIIGPTTTINIAGGLVLPPAWGIYVAQSVYAGTQDAIDWIVEGGDY